MSAPKPVSPGPALAPGLQEGASMTAALPTCPPNPGEIKRLPDEAGRPVPVEDPASMKPVN